MSYPSTGTIHTPIASQQFMLGKYQSAVDTCIADLQAKQVGRQLWQKKVDLWSSQQDRSIIANALGWLDIPIKMSAHLEEITTFAQEIHTAGFKQLIFMGMGGSSLAPLVMEKILPKSKDGLAMTVLDTTNPDAIQAIADQCQWKESLFIVASKSGTTIEPLAFEAYFYQKMRELMGDRAGEHFVAITDPGTALAQSAQDLHFRKVFLNEPDIGGRYSALSLFGLVPAALIGVDLHLFLDRSLQMVHACGPNIIETANPGILLGTAIGELARSFQRNKITFLMPSSLSSLGLWLEQLLAESTGKEGKGILPIAGEPVGPPEVYGQDRLFVHMQLLQEPDTELTKAVNSLNQAGHPVITFFLQDRYDLAQEFYRWEIATAVIGMLLEINPFNQPNVQESKDVTHDFLESIKQNGSVLEPKPAFENDLLKIYADLAYPVASLTDVLSQFICQAKPDDYFAQMAYLPENEPIEQLLQAIRLVIRNHLHLATTSGYGPRFLHSTGQFHKGGPNTGLFLQLTATPIADIPIPGRHYSFGSLIQAQALGDFHTLKQHQRRVMRIDLGEQPVEALTEVVVTLMKMIENDGLTDLNSIRSTIERIKQFSQSHTLDGLDWKKLRDGGRQ